MQRVRGKLSFSNVVAVLALFVALGGGAYAATRLPRNSVGAKQLKKGAVTASKVKAHSLTAASFKAGLLQAGPRGPAGPQGAAGPQGPAGQAGGVLPSGVTLRGSVGTGAQTSTASNRVLTTGVGFDGYQVAGRPIPHIVHETEPPIISATAACPGSVSNPQAAPGNLCVYLSEITPNASVTLFVGDPAGINHSIGVTYTQTGTTATQSTSGDGRVSPDGFIFSESAVATSEGEAYGTWAVTAP